MLVIILGSSAKPFLLGFFLQIYLWKDPGEGDLASTPLILLRLVIYGFSYMSDAVASIKSWCFELSRVKHTILYRWLYQYWSAMIFVQLLAVRYWLLVNQF
jgi:hypothetical protein